MALRRPSFRRDRLRRPAGATAVRAVAALGLALLALAGPVQAQSNPFRPVVEVNDRVITAWEIDQRARLLRLFRSPGDPAEAAREALIDERLQLAAADRLGIRPSPEAVEAGMAEFAGRADLSVEDFVEQIGRAGVAEATFRDFVRAGVAWREVVRARFGPRAQVTEAEIDRALALTARRGGAEALISEIVIPARTPQEQARAESLAAEIAAEVRGAAAFAAAARQYSAAPTRAEGGRVAGPVAVSDLPRGLRAQILTLAPGDVSEPVPLGNAVAVFLLRELRETGLAPPETVSVEYARFRLPDGLTARAAAAQVDRCDDLYGLNAGRAEAALTIETRASAEIPAEIARALARLDEGETTELRPGGRRELLMLCGRTALTDAEPDRAAIRARLIDQRLAAYADGFLAELRADARIRTP